MILSNMREQPAQTSIVSQRAEVSTKVVLEKAMTDITLHHAATDYEYRKSVETLAAYENVRSARVGGRSPIGTSIRHMATWRTLRILCVTW